MKKILTLSASFPRLILLLLLGLTVLAATQLNRLQIDISAQSMMVKTDPLWLTYQQSLETYGSDNVVIIFLQDDDLFSPEKLQKIQTLNQNLQALDFVTGSSSLFNVPNVNEVDGYIVTKPFLDTIPQQQQALDALLAAAASNPMVNNNLVSTDGKTMAINLFLDGAIHYPGRDSEITRALEQQLQPMREHLDTVFQMGSSYVRDAISEQILQDQQQILPASLAILILVLGFSLKRFNCAIVPLTTALMSIVLTLSVMALLEVPVNVLTSIVPALLIIIGSTEDVHLLAEYHAGIEQQLSRPEAVARLPQTQSVAILLTFITTFVGFMSITVNDLELLSQFGWVVSMGLALNFLITILFIPAYLQLFGSRQPRQQATENYYQRFARAIFHVVIRFKKTTLAILLITGAVFIWGAQFLQVNNNTLDYFGADSEVNIRAAKIHQQLSGMQTFSILLDSSIEGTFLKVRYLQDIHQLQQFIEQRRAFDKTVSFADFIMLTNKVMEGTKQLSMPYEDDLVRSYMGLVQPDTVKNYVSEDYSSARILVRHNLHSSRQLDAELAEIQRFIDDELNTSLRVQFSGESVLTNRAADSMAIGQIQSLLLMVVVIFLLVSLLFIDIRAGLLAIVPNIYPVIILFGVMGYLQIPLNTGTTMVAVIALGICVDDTIHFLSRYHFFTRGTQDVEQALRQTVEHEATPIITTSLSLALGFAVLTLSSFQPLVHFGALSALVMLLAMFSTFVLTPILLSYTRLITVWDMLSLNLKSSVLEKSVFFHGLNNFEIKKAILSGNIVQFNQGDIMVEQGQDGTDMYVILEGSAAVARKEDDGSVHTLGTLTVGDLFGEISLLANYHRMARVTAREYAKVLVIKWDSISQLGRFHPRISMKLFRNLSSVISKRMANPARNDLVMRDEVTGAVTRPFLYEQLQLEVDRARRHAEELSLIILEIEFLNPSPKPSPLADSQALKAITRMLAEQTRRVDIFARWGESRFVVLMPRTSAVLASGMTERMKSAIEKCQIDGVGRLHISAAVTQTSGDETVQALLSKIEHKLDAMKTSNKSLSIARA
ncbi:MAG: MMPL family transporter [Gammaproteobacteria bacterium]|nr:MMPL family transporter [Gammaproteobacteria bacterium]MBL6999094.1 MMPL family transporter [Gammaproteobacteria bacterium]